MFWKKIKKWVGKKNFENGKEKLRKEKTSETESKD